MGVRVDDVAQAKAVLRGERDIAIELVEVRIDDHAGATFVIADQVRQATAASDLFEEHQASSSSISGIAAYAARHAGSWRESRFRVAEARPRSRITAARSPAPPAARTSTQAPRTS